MENLTRFLTDDGVMEIGEITSIEIQKVWDGDTLGKTVNIFIVVSDGVNRMAKFFEKESKMRKVVSSLEKLTGLKAITTQDDSIL